MAQLQRCDYLGDTYAVRMLPLCKMLGDQFDELEDEVLIALDATERITTTTTSKINLLIREFNLTTHIISSKPNFRTVMPLFCS